MKLFRDIRKGHIEHGGIEDRKKDNGGQKQDESSMASRSGGKYGIAFIFRHGKMVGAVPTGTSLMACGLLSSLTCARISISCAPVFITLYIKARRVYTAE